MNIIKYSLFVTIVALTSESAWLPDNCFHISEEKGSLSAQRGLDVLPQCTIFLSNNRPLPVISCPAPGIVRFEGEYDYVQINCSASYPLDFKFNGTKPTEAIQVSFRRTVKENSKGEIVLFHADVTVFSIRALHRLYAGSNPNWKQSISKQYQYSRTGGYTFLGFREKAFLKTDFYFFFEEQLASPGFIINREDRKLRWDQFGKIIIPCRATHFNSLVTLEQETNFPALFIYSLTQGFISHQKVTGVHGTFFCRLHDRGNGTVVKYGTQREAPYGYHVKPKDYNVDIQYNVTALPRGHFETKTRCRPSCGTFDCGSNETAVLASISVPNPAMDNLLNDFVLPKFQLRSYTVRVERTQKDINHEIRFENGTLEHFAAAYCGSRDRSKNRSSFGRTLTGIVYPFKYGHDWSEVNQDNAEIGYYLKIWHDRPGQDLYENENILFECRLHTFVLPPPSIWYFEWDNGTITEELVDYHWTDGVSRLPAKLSFGIKNVYCAGSIWHKTYWINMSIPINVLPSTIPYFKHEGNPIKRFVSSSTLQYLKCTAYGGPEPTIIWEHDGKNITTVISTMDYSLLYFNEVNAAIQGMYDCIACNVVGCKKKIYTVEVYSVDTPEAQCLTEVREPQGGSILAYSAVLLVLMVTLVAIDIVTRWRAQKFFRIGNQTANGMDKKDLYAFFRGGNWATGGEPGRSQPYDEDLYEISKDRFTYNEIEPLGEGEFGVVFHGTVDDEDIAVKMVKENNLQHLKFLMSELKTMIHVGHHKNLVDLVGAYTGELKKNKLYVFLKLCELGSLKNYLIEKRHSFLLTKPKYVPFSDVSCCGNNFTVEDLFKWAKGIAEGMKYLRSKKVMHRDLAARNILLDSTRTVKVADFGLSRRIYGYDVNRRDDDGPGVFPWQWMALESLRCRSYLYESDVWSYGVTLWEIFSLGDDPYPNETWNSSFILKLEGGLRLPQPRYASDRLFYEIMDKCWESAPCQRPAFEEIVQRLQKLPVNADSQRIRM